MRRLVTDPFILVPVVSILIGLTLNTLNVLARLRFYDIPELIIAKLGKSKTAGNTMGR